MDLTTTARVRLYKGWSSESVRNTWIDTEIAAISSRVETELRRKVLSEAQSEVFTVDDSMWPDGQLFRLKAFPVTDGSITVYSDLDRAFGSGTVVSASDYYADLNIGTVFVEDFHLDVGYKTLKIAYTGGMAADTTAFVAAFPELAGAVDLQVAYNYESRNRLGINSVTGPDGSLTIMEPMGLLPALTAAISKFRRHTLFR